MTDIGSLNIRITASTENLQNGIKQAQGHLSTLDQTIGRVQRTLIAFAALQVFRGFIDGAKEAVKTASDFSLAMAHVSRMTEIHGESLNQFKQTLKDLSITLPITTMELSKMAVVAAQAGVETSAGIQKLVKTASVLTVLNTELGKEETVKALVRLAKGMNIPMEDANKLAAALQYVGDSSVGGATDVVNATLRMISAGKSLDFTAAQLMAIAGLTIDVGLEANRAGTVWNRAFIQIATNAAKAAQVVGVSTSEFRDMIQKNQVDALILLLQKLGEIENRSLRLQKINEIFSGIGLRGIGPLIDQVDKLSLAMKNAGDVYEKGTYHIEQYARIQDELAIKAQTTRNNWNLMKQEMAEDWQTALTKRMEEITGVFDKLRVAGQYSCNNSFTTGKLSNCSLA